MRPLVLLTAALLLSGGAWARGPLLPPESPPPADPVDETAQPPLARWRVTWRQITARETIVDAHDSEEAICLTNIELFTTRDRSQLSAC